MTSKELFEYSKGLSAKLYQDGLKNYEQAIVIGNCWRAINEQFLELAPDAPEEAKEGHEDFKEVYSELTARLIEKAWSAHWARN